MSDAKQSTDELVETLQDIDGVKKVRVRTTVTVEVDHRTTGEYDEMHQPIRERAVSEDEIASLIDNEHWSYSGPVKVEDFYIRDQINGSFIYE